MVKKNNISLFAIILLSFILISFLLYFKFTTGDAFTHMTYAKDIIEGKGYSFTGNKTYGSTSPLWPILIAIVGKISNLKLEIVAKMLSFIFTILSFSLFYKITSEKFTKNSSFLALLLFSFNSYLMRWVFCGMETTAAVFFSVFLLYIYFHPLQQKINKLIFFFLGFSTLIRPEFYLFITIFFLHKIFISKDKKDWLINFTIALIPSLLWNLFAYFYFGTIIPSSFKAKVGDVNFSINLKIILRNLFLLLSGNPIERLTTLILIIIFIMKKKKEILHRLIKYEYLPIFLSVFLFYFLYLIKGILLISRYTTPLIPFIIVFTTFLLETFFTEYNLTNKAKRFIIFSILSFSFLFNALFTCFIIKPDADSFINGFQTHYKNMAKLLSKEENKNATVMLYDVSIIGLYSGLKVYDFTGVVDNERQNFKSNYDFFYNKKPNYIVLKNEFSIDTINGKYCNFEKLYSCSLSGYGITNNKIRFPVNLYKVEWKLKEKNEW
ncbi:MAG: hypothetical protein N2053_09080 [Chitinispirillaceae bacterium]|nr:hypothetical protein [Chitinispirillaceae bacterium]